MQKVPVKIVQTKDIHGTKKIGVMLDVAYYIESVTDPDAQVKKFKKLYIDTLEKAKDLIPYKGSKRSTKDFWKLSKLLLDLKKSTGNEFIITNFRNALQRDFLFTGRYVARIVEFAQIFKKNEILDSILISYYIELIQKKSKLEKLGIFEKEKKRLLKMGMEDTLPGVMQYRQQLQKLLQKGRKLIL